MDECVVAIDDGSEGEFYLCKGCWFLVDPTLWRTLRWWQCPSLMLNATGYFNSVALLALLQSVQDVWVTSKSPIHCSKLWMEANLYISEGLTSLSAWMEISVNNIWPLLEIVQSSMTPCTSSPRNLLIRLVLRLLPLSPNDNNTWLSCLMKLLINARVVTLPEREQMSKPTQSTSMMGVFWHWFVAMTFLSF